jgi:hypothetical protein
MFVIVHKCGIFFDLDAAGGWKRRPIIFLTPIQKLRRLISSTTTYQHKIHERGEYYSDGVSHSRSQSSILLSPRSTAKNFYMHSLIIFFFFTVTVSQFLQMETKTKKERTKKSTINNQPILAHNP